MTKSKREELLERGERETRRSATASTDSLVREWEPMEHRRTAAAGAGERDTKESATKRRTA